MKKLIIVFLLVMVVHVIGFTIYKGFDNLYHVEREAIKEICEDLTPGQSLNLEFLRKKNILLTTFEIVDSQRFEKRYKGSKIDIKKNFNLIRPEDFSYLFFLADGFNRKSVGIHVKEGIITSVNCNQ